MGRALLALLLTSCVQSGLTPCESKSCPTDKVCDTAGAEPTCVYPEQLTECGDKVDGDPCTIRNTPVSSCIGGVCQPVECGNHIRTADEACDDGNNASGDGCAADCRSNETCGNGVLDLAAAEQCDDGNTEDLDACRNDCSLPRCGDALLDPLEECEPTLGVTKTCADFGYYTGDLGCSATCRFDPVATCIGRCGDDVVQADQGEECDGGPPPQSCVDIGFDYGAATCTSSCSATSCDRFGWRFVAPAGYLLDLGGDDGRVAAVLSDGSLQYETASGLQTRTGGYVAVSMRGDDVLAAKATSVELYSQGVWTTLAQPPLSGTIINKAIFADDGTPTLLACSSSCLVLQLVGATWSARAEPPALDLLIARGVGEWAAASTTSSDLVWETGGVPSSVQTQPTATFAYVNAGSLAVYYQSGSTLAQEFIGLTGGGANGPDVSRTYTAGHQAVVVDGVVYIQDGNSFNVQMQRGGPGSRVELFDGAPSTTGQPTRLFVTRDKRVIAASNGSLYELGDLHATKRTLPSSILVPYSDISLAEDGALLVCERRVWVSLFETVSDVATSSSIHCESIWGRSARDLFVARDDGISNANLGLFHFDGTSWIEELMSGTNARVPATQIAGQGATLVALVGGQLVTRAGTHWSAGPALPSGCGANRIAVQLGAIYAAGGCSTTTNIWQLVSGAWVELYSAASTTAVTKLVSLAVFADGSIFAATGTRDVVGYYAGTWHYFTGIGSIVAGTSAHDVVATATGSSAVGATPVLHFDGTRWSPIRTPTTLQYMRLVANGLDLIAVGATVPAPTPAVVTAFIRH